MTQLEEIQQVFKYAEKRLTEIMNKTIRIHMTLNDPTHDNFLKIANIVCDALGVELSDVLANNRKKEVAEARALCMYYIYNKTRATKVSIGKFFNKDHTSVIHLLKIVNDRIYIKDERTGYNINLIEKNVIWNEA